MGGGDSESTFEGHMHGATRSQYPENWSTPTPLETPAGGAAETQERRERSSSKRKREGGHGGKPLRSIAFPSLNEIVADGKRAAREEAQDGMQEH